MGEIELADGHVALEATLIAADFGLDAPGVLEAMRTGRLTCVWERGVDNDAGRFRVTFFHGNRQLRLIVDATGQILERSLAQSHSLRLGPTTEPRNPRRERSD
jgi:hypothetical protein